MKNVNCWEKLKIYFSQFLTSRPVFQNVSSSIAYFGSFDKIFHSNYFSIFIEKSTELAPEICEVASLLFKLSAEDFCRGSVVVDNLE